MHVLMRDSLTADILQSVTNGLFSDMARMVVLIGILMLTLRKQASRRETPLYHHCVGLDNNFSSLLGRVWFGVWVKCSLSVHAILSILG